MTRPENCLYRGVVTHRRLQPVQHHLAYNVACIFLDVDRIAETARGLWLFSYNRWNIFSIRDRGFGPRDGTPVATHLWSIVQQTPGADNVVRRIFMLAYPNIMGFGFNPLTTYYGLDDDGQIRLAVYEVRNTFGGMHHYVTPLFAPGEPCHSLADKAFLVSPFNRVEGHYGLTASRPGETLGLGVSLTTQDGPIMKAYFAAKRRPLTDGELLKIFIALPFMTIKVVAGIHWEALKLWVKGMRLPAPRVGQGK
jgi:uncharacterized protein